MNFTISSSALASVLQSTIKIIASKNTLPILDCFLIEVHDSILEVTASSESTAIHVTTPIIGNDGDARFCVNAKQFVSAIKEIPEQPVIIEYTKDKSKIKGRHTSGKFSLMCQESDVYPRMKDIAEGSQFSISATTLRDGLSRCLFATSTDDLLSWKTCICIDIKPDNVVFAATDGRKLVRDTHNSVKSEYESQIKIPRNVAMLVSDAIKGDGEVTITFDAEHAKLSTDDTVIYYRQTEGRFPNYNAVIPSTRTIRVNVDRGSMLSALKRVGVFCNKSSGLVKFKFGKNLITLAGQDKDYAISAEELITCEYDGDEFSIGFGHQFLIEVMKGIGCETVTMEFVQPDKPCVCLPASPNGSDELLMLLMPMKIEE